MQKKLLSMNFKKSFVCIRYFEGYGYDKDKNTEKQMRKVIRVFGRDFQLAIKWCVLNELFWKQLGYDKLTSLLVFNVFLEKNTF